MTMQFNEFKTYFQAHVSHLMSNVQKGVIFISDVSKEELWDTYLNSFPEDVRQSFNCNSCRQFIKYYGGLVKVNPESMMLTTLWNFEVPDPMYQQVVDNLSELVFRSKIRDVFVNNQPKLGTDFNFQSQTDTVTSKALDVIRWDHFYYLLNREEYQKVSAEKDIVPSQAVYRDTKNVFKRALDEITPYAVQSVIDLEKEGNLYRGNEFIAAVKSFQALQEEYQKLSSERSNSVVLEKLKDDFAWVSCQKNGARIRNSAIGTLLIDISSDTDLEIAVKKYESVVAPTNYKRPKSIITAKMVEEAEKTIIDLGYKKSLGRRFANHTDIKVNNTLYLNRGQSITIGTLKGDSKIPVFQSLKEEIPVSPKSLKNVQEIRLDKFLSDEVPKADSISILFEKSKENNLVSLITAVDNEAPSLFKWEVGDGSLFSWSYNNGVADSIKEKVKKAGGKVDGKLRISLDWDGYTDLDLLLEEPKGGETISFRNMRSRTGGHLDVDANGGRGTTKEPVENIIYSYDSKLLEGVYRVRVNNYEDRGLTEGFTVEIEFGGEIYTFATDKVIRDGEWVDIAEFKYSTTSGITFISGDASNSQVQSTKIWEIDTNKFQKVNMIMYSPNYWDGAEVGNKHLFFIIDKCRNSKANGFYGEFLKEELYKNHKRVFEMLTHKLEVEDDGQEQLSGFGFSLSSNPTFYVKVEGNNSTRIFKVVSK